MQPFVCRAKEVVFIRVPKTGSTAVTKVVNNPRTGPGWNELASPTHVRACEVSTEWIEKYRHYTWVGGIRHPETWIPSLKKWLETKPLHQRERWLRSGVVSDNWYTFINDIRYTPFDWLYHPEISVVAYPQENPAFLEEILGVSLERKFNETLHPLTFKPDSRTKELISTKFHRELAYYGDSR